MGGHRACPLNITFAGQSLNNTPTGANSYPNQLLALLQPSIVTGSFDAWEGGISWLQFVTQPGAYAAANAALLTIQSQVGGTTDYALGRSGAQVYADESTIAAAARAAGFNYIIGTTTTASVSITGGNETARVAGNALLTNSAALLANGGQFNAVVDFAGSTSLATDITNNDGTHPTVVGAGIMAGLMRTAILTLLGL